MGKLKTKSKLAVIIIGFIFLLIVTIPALAESGSITIFSVVSSTCAPGGFLTVGVDIGVDKTGTYKVVRTITNPVRGTTSAAESTWTQGSGQFEVSAPIPANTQVDDDLIFQVALTNSLGAAYDNDWIRVDCTTGVILEHDKPTPTPSDTPTVSGTPATATITPTGTLPTGTPGVTGTPGAGGTPSPGPTATLSVEDMLKIPNSQGILPCGIFNVMGWGLKVVYFGFFSGCNQWVPVLTVECLNDHAQWTTSEVHDIVYSPDGKSLTFVSTQHGHCGLFPINP